MKTYLIVGHRGGIGSAITGLLLERGDAVIGLSRDVADLQHHNLRQLQIDVLEWDGTGLPEALEGLVYAPGSINLKPFRSYRPEEFRADFELNALGAALTLQKAERALRSLAEGWAPAVRVNALAPSLTDTPLASKLLGTEARAAAAAERNPLKRVGQPNDLASAGLALLDNPWVTGQILGVDGGMSTIRP
jgi:3-oxoacyl-[acyl-carrier protein] reductase